MSSERANEIASTILNRITITGLQMQMRFLYAAFSQYTLQPNDEHDLATDGSMLIYNPERIIDWYEEDPNIVNRNYLHCVIHGIYRHMYNLSRYNEKIWDLAADIATEIIIEELIVDEGLGKLLKTARGDDQQSYIMQLKNDVDILSAEKIYYYLMDSGILDNETEYETLCRIFSVDDHYAWHIYDELEQPQNGNQGNGGDSDDSSSGGNGNEDGDGNDGDGNDGDSQSNGQGSSNGGGRTYNEGGSFGFQNIDRKRQEEDWKKISEQIKTDLETFSKNYGTAAGAFVGSIGELNREKYDYTDFLMRFAEYGEVMKVNDDEFDTIYYSLGMDTYGNTPIIEPLEYKEDKRVKEFVIAIDTSGSVIGELVIKFVTKTYNILKSTENFHQRVNIHIIQCDADIQEHVKITCNDEFDEYIKNMTIKGGGGTDFRPVFDLVNGLIAEHEFENLKGLIYFSDGYGEFPRIVPTEYETAFVFVTDDLSQIPDIPPWAIKINLPPTDFRE